MTGPTVRVLAVLELLQSHQRITGSELANRLGVNRRTVRRYITVLEELGVPVTTEQGRYGGYMLVPGFKLPPMMFTDDEVLAISLGLLAARQLGLAQATPATDSAETKLQRVMPDALKRRLRGVMATTKLLLPPPDHLHDERALITLVRAVEAQQRVAFSYRAPGKSDVERKVDPYGLTFWNGHWYLSGYCHLRSALRSFRLDRMRNVQPVPAHFQRPEPFDSAEHLLQSLGTFERNHSVSVVLHTDRDTAANCLDFYPTGKAIFQPHPNGLLFDTHTDSLEWFACWLAGLPFSFTIEAPEALKEAVQRHANKLLAACGCASQYG